LTEPDKNFKTIFGEKKEYRLFSNFDETLRDWANFTSSTKFITSLQSKFGIPQNNEIDSDPNYDGGGYVISPPGSFLSYHADFNFSSGIEKFRVLNVLFYLNDNYDSKLGGHLHLLDEQSKTVEKIVFPIPNRMLAFLTDDTSFHGVSKNLAQFHRRSFNMYYYAKSPLSKNQSPVPHKTIWISPE
jgi:Rps23 Pro-64 3,4-dihydroxylase Tpa1-like proline 4-hydroxylase